MVIPAFIGWTIGSTLGCVLAGGAIEVLVLLIVVNTFLGWCTAIYVASI